MKRLLLMTMMSMVSVPALAQTPAAYTLTVTPQEVNVIGTALGARPYMEVQGLMQKLTNQVLEQNKPASKAEDKPPEPPK